MFSRLQILKWMGWLGVASLAPKFLMEPLFAQNRMSLDEAVKNQLGVTASALKVSPQVLLNAPEMAENGGAVPIQVTSPLSVDTVDSIYLFVDKNPKPFIFKMNVTPMSGEVFISTRIKMGESSNVRAVVKTKNGQLLMAQKNIRVTAGGCN